jgi:hypothetical protein
VRPDEYSVIATPNLHGDCLSDAVAALVGGVGLAAGADIGGRAAMFEAAHGTVPPRSTPARTGPTPGAVLRSGVLLLEHLGWGEAAKMVNGAVASTGAKGPGGRLYLNYGIARQFPATARRRARPDRRSPTASSTTQGVTAVRPQRAARGVSGSGGDSPSRLSPAAGGRV